MMWWILTGALFLLGWRCF